MDEVSIFVEGMNALHARGVEIRHGLWSLSSWEGPSDENLGLPLVEAELLQQEEDSCKWEEAYQARRNAPGKKDYTKHRPGRCRKARG